ncbi:stage III sporulation protein AA [Clostridium sp. MD294]|uniref:stage III sporulation protein AA n=1 Tax=Clostridium sp. MD294 TaxID=97138 RepID=UPI0002C9D715|nr:stage III sporulation protein AA [Clostridium sp. MD294]NDO45488.1 stage III sporulation protein AA [Clostridium sp. MD294]USF30862.1 hypothetical protein C820_002306 [Clostridium sp. MD294]
MSVKNVLLKTFGENLKQIIQSLKQDFLEEIEEIHIRVEKPLFIFAQRKEYIIKEDGSITDKIEEAYFPKREDIQHILERASRYSLYAFSEEIKNGFLTIEGGHRIGIVGKVVVENGAIKAIQNISALNIRISHEVKGCSDMVLKYVIENKNFYNTLLVSPPACGKTTLLRDMVRQLSNGKKGFFEGQTVGVADERGEIAGCYKGVAQNDVGIRTDILDCCPKAEGMLMLVRSMSPHIIAVDEIGKKEDFVAIESIVNAGIQLLCTIHGNDLEDVKKREILGNMIKNGVFHSIVVLSAKKRVGEIQTIYNRNLEIVYKM